MTTSNADDIAWLLQAVDNEADEFPAVTGRVPGTRSYMENWVNWERPGYFGRRRDTIQARFSAEFGADNWRLAWVVYANKRSVPFTFAQACRVFYEESYYRFLKDRPADVDFICEFAECMDNSATNVHSGLDYTLQEASSTHIQDIAVRNVLRRLGRTFTGKREELLIIRSVDSNGFAFGPGNVPFFQPSWIMPSMRPKWANENSVEDFWQSNKFLQVRTGSIGDRKPPTL